MQGLTDGLGLGVENMTLGVRPPRQAGDLVNGGGISGGCRGGVELCGERMASPFGIKSRQRGAHDQAKLCPSPKMGLCWIRFSGSIGLLISSIAPRRLCRDTGPPSLAGFVFLGLR